MNDELTAILTELRRRFEALYGERLIQMILFGSQARGDAEPGSDIDVLVVLKDPVQAGKKSIGLLTSLLIYRLSTMKSSVVCSWVKIASRTDMGRFYAMFVEKGSEFDRRPAGTA